MRDIASALTEARCLVDPCGMLRSGVVATSARLARALRLDFVLLLSVCGLLSACDGKAQQADAAPEPSTRERGLKPEGEGRAPGEGVPAFDQIRDEVNAAHDHGMSKREKSLHVE